MPSGCISRSFPYKTVWISEVRPTSGVERAVISLNADRMLSSPLAYSSFDISFLKCFPSVSSSRTVRTFLEELNIPSVEISISICFISYVWYSPRTLILLFSARSQNTKFFTVIFLVLNCSSQRIRMLSLNFTIGDSILIDVGESFTWSRLSTTVNRFHPSGSKRPNLM